VGHRNSDAWRANSILARSLIAVDKETFVLRMFGDETFELETLNNGTFELDVLNNETLIWRL
jgi:hypothetical protein